MNLKMINNLNKNLFKFLKFKIYLFACALRWVSLSAFEVDLFKLLFSS